LVSPAAVAAVARLRLQLVEPAAAVAARDPMVEAEPVAVSVAETGLVAPEERAAQIPAEPVDQAHPMEQMALEQAELEERRKRPIASPAVVAAVIGPQTALAAAVVTAAAAVDHLQDPMEPGAVAAATLTVVSSIASVRRLALRLQQMGQFLLSGIEMSCLNLSQLFRNFHHVMSIIIDKNAIFVDNYRYEDQEVPAPALC
jgi:hypothetical protein